MRIFIRLGRGLLLPCILVLFACTTESPQMACCSVSVNTENNGSKTSIDDNVISFLKGDEIVLFCHEYNKCKLYNENCPSVNYFTGKMYANGKKGTNCNWYAVYPASVQDNAGILSGAIKSIQEYPYDVSNNYMVSDILVHDYCETESFSFTFNMNQIVGIIRIRFTNTNELYEDDIVKSVEISGDKVLAGDFKYNVFGQATNPEFDELGSKRVCVRSTLGERLGLGQEHIVYIFCNPTTLNTSTICINTDNHLFKITKADNISIKRNSLTSITFEDFSKFTVEDYKISSKSINCWGDSFTNAGYSSYPVELQQLLGLDWIVYNGGKSGDKVDEIAARSGGLEIYTGNQFEIPEGCTSVTTDGAYKVYNGSMERGYYPIIRLSDGALGKPYLICGVPCSIWSASGKMTVTRIEPGEKVTVPTNTKIESFAARSLRNSALTIIYMGTNGGFDIVGDYATNPDAYKNLIAYHKLITDYSSFPDDYIILGYHSSNYNSNYWNQFTKAFPPSRLINLHDLIPANGIELMIATGAYPQQEAIPEDEIKRINKNEIPLCFRHSEYDYHPSPYGARAFAILIHDKMVQLGYLTEPYILSTGGSI